MARDGIALRKFGQQVIEGLAKERIHPSWIVPGGVNAPLDPTVRERILQGLPEAKAIAARTMAFFKGVVDTFPDEIANFGNTPTCTRGWSTPAAACSSTTVGALSSTPRQVVAVEAMPAEDYQNYIGEASVSTPISRRPISSRSAILKASIGSARWRASTSRPIAGRLRPTSSSPNTISGSARWCRARSTSTTRGWSKSCTRSSGWRR